MTQSLPETGRPARGRPRSPAIATALSFLFPGLGQGYAGRRQPAVIFAIPILVVALVLGATALGGLGGLAQLVIDPTSALAVTIVILLLAVWRILAMHDARRDLATRGSRAHGRGSAVFAILALIVVVTHGLAGYGAWSFYEAGRDIFGVPPAAPDVVDPDGSLPPEVLPDFRLPPFATPETQEARVNVLFIGVDSAESRTTTLTDTLLVVSVDPKTGAVAMVSFPRDIADFTLSDGRVYTGKVNSLMTWARNHPDDFPDGPLPSLAKELGFLLGIPIHYFAAIDLAGFSLMIDAVGGVTVDNPRLIDDPTYGWLDGRRGFRLAAGKHRLDGESALAYVRTRKGVGDSDFGRARRQQQVLVALQREIMKPEALARIPVLTKAAARTISTNFPTGRVGEFIDLALELDGDGIKQVVLGPPYARRATGPGVTDYRIRLDMKRLARLSIELFGGDSRYASGGG